ncbi:hypothetical protein BDP81DRAFT_60627 [Colletotrichum phormii]|uniref:Uncharacterized protein n=1 Tax=Colletotrichum phormii TaxID=359342 RepID=A0AAI9ZM73_9PEZI|nr:uncharacterized protein BDP81DRAFT_60627 [Colletotrichum phormii]KAK1634550.1 hypothetical protein BDP81DRAFT_60627 [Colletotrichum phormii]
MRTRQLSLTMDDMNATQFNLLALDIVSWPASKPFGGAPWEEKENFPTCEQLLAPSPANTPSNERRKAMQYLADSSWNSAHSLPCQSPTPLPPLQDDDQVAPHQSPRRRRCTVSTGMPLATRQGCGISKSLAAGLMFRLGLSTIPQSSRRRTHSSIPYRAPCTTSSAVGGMASSPKFPSAPAYATLFDTFVGNLSGIL